MYKYVQQQKQLKYHLTVHHTIPKRLTTMT